MTSSTKTTQNAATTTQTKSVKSMVDTLIKLDSQSDSVFVDLAAALYQAKKFDAHTTAGFSADHAGFVEFCDNKLRLGYRKAQYLIGIWEKALEFNIKKEVMEGIGWGKMKELVPVINQGNVDKLIAAAQSMTLKALQDFISTLKRSNKEVKEAGNGVNSSAVATVKYTFLIAEEDNDTVTMAIEEAKKRMETGNAAEAFVTICQDWLALGGAETLPNTLEEYMDFLQRRFGVILEVSSGKSKTTQQPKEKTAPASEKKVEAPITEAAPESAPSASTPETEALFGMDIKQLKSFAAENKIVIPSTMKGKVVIRDFLISEVLKGNTEAEAGNDLDVLNDVEAPTGAPEDEEGDDVDLNTADHATLLAVAKQYNIEIPKALKPAKQVETLRKHVMDTLKAMGVGEEEEEQFPDNQAIIDAEEEKEVVDAAEGDLKKLAGFLKEKEYATAYSEKFGKLSSKDDPEVVKTNILYLITEKYGVTFEPVTEGEDDLLGD